MKETTTNYFKFVKKTQIPAAIDCGIYMLAATYVAIAHANLGSVWLPVAVVVWLIAELIGIKIAHLKWSIKSAYKMYLYSDVAISLMMALAIVILNDKFIIAIVIAIAGVVVRITQSAHNEAMSRFERRNFIKDTAHRYSAVLRKRDESWQVMSGLCGSLLALFMYSILELDLDIPTAIALVLAGPVLNWWQMWLANKYLY